jgi:hypothetical protein
MQQERPFHSMKEIDMFQFSTLRRTPVAIAVGAVAVLSLASPAAASDRVDIGAAKHGGVQVSQVSPPVDTGRARDDIDTPLPPPVGIADTGPDIVFVNDDALEYAQIAIAALAGAALTAAGLGSLTARRRHASRPA